MNKKEFIEFSAKLGKLLGVNPTMDNYTFSDPKSPVFQIKEKELRSVVRKAKALKDKEAHGIEDIEWDFEEGYIAFMLPGGFALYLSTEADMEMSEANNANAVNEAVDEKEFFKAFTKATGLKVSRESEVYDDRAGLVSIDAYTAARIRFGALKPGTYGEFKIKSVKPTGYRDFDVVVGYNNEDYTLRFDNAGSARTSAANAKPLADKLLKELNAKSLAMGKLRTYCVADVDPVAYDKLKNLKAGTTVGDIIVTEVGTHPNGVYGGMPFIVEVVHPKGFAELVFRNAVELEDLKNDAKNLSSEMSEAIQYAIGLNESSNAALLKLAQTAAKALGIKFKETPSSYKALMGASFEITEKDFIKIVKEFKRAQSDPAAFGFYEMTFDNPEMSVLIDFEDEEDGILFYVGGMNESLQNELDFGNAIMKHLGIKGKQIGRTNVFEVSGRDRMKIDKLKANDELGDIIIFGVKDDNYSTNLEVKTYLMPKTVTVKFTDEAEMFESSAVNEATNTLNEASEARMRKKARDIARFFGVEIDETVGSFGFFASSAGIDKSSYDKIIKIINQTKGIEKKLGVNFVEVWSKVNSIRFNVYRSEDDIFFKLQGMNESYDDIPEYTPGVNAGAMNESTKSTGAVELNEVTGLPKHKTSVPSHLI